VQQRWLHQSAANCMPAAAPRVHLHLLLLLHTLL
jgi:hypothetical protein